MAKLTIALAKGRLQLESLKLFYKAGISVADEQINSRRLIISDSTDQYHFVLVKPSDVPVYVEYGVADAGICGRDVILERAADVHQPLDLGIGYCRMAVAGRRDEAALKHQFATLRVATKYPRIASNYFQQLAVPVELITLSGSIELAPLLGLADRIVDLVETGRTLLENGLEIKEVILETTAQMIVNRASFQLKRPEIMDLIARLTDVVAAKKLETSKVVE